MLPFNTIFDAAEKEMTKVDLSEGSKKCYRNVFRKISEFAQQKNTVYYSKEFGAIFLITYLEISKKCSRTTTDYLKKTIRYFDSYLDNHVFGFGTFLQNGWLTPSTPCYISLLNEYEISLQSTLKKSSILNYRSSVAKYLCYLESIKVIDINDVLLGHFPDYLNRQKDKLSDNTFANNLVHLRSVVSFLGREDLLFYLRFLKPNCSKHIVPTLTNEEHNKLLSYLRNGNLCYRDKAIVLLAIYTGMRSSDIRALKLSDIDWKNDQFSFTQTKTGNPVRLPMMTEPWNAIYEYIKYDRTKCELSEVFLVDKYAPVRPLTSSAIKTIIEKVCTAAGIELGNRPRGTRLLRHNTGTLLLRNDVPQSTIAAILGHADINTTSIYISTDEETLRECCLPFLPSMKEVKI